MSNTTRLADLVTWHDQISAHKAEAVDLVEDYLDEFVEAARLLTG